ncbi:MAG: peptide MFS transporter [Negativicutes bacterium]
MVKSPDTNSLPRSMYYLSGTEMWERFSYYGIMSMLILYLTKGLGIPDERAGLIVGTYISFTWMSPVLGGWLADKFLGQVNAILIGGLGIFLGNLILAINLGGLNGFFLGLSTIILGTGLLKSSISVIIGELFTDGDPRIDRAYTVFYLFINIGSLLSASIAEIAQRSDNFGIGFAFATIGMLFGLLIFWRGMRTFKKIDRVNAKPALGGTSLGISNKVWIGLLLVVSLPIVVFFFLFSEITNYFMLLSGVVVIATIIGYWIKYKSRRDRLGIMAILIYVVYQIGYFSLYQQVSDSIILFMDRVVDMQVFGISISSGAASLLFNSGFILFLAPALAWIYSLLGKIKKEPGTPVKFFIALLAMALSFLIFGLVARSSMGGAMASIWPVILGFFVFTISDVLSGPICLSLIVQLSPKQITGFMMGAMFFSMAAGGYVSGLLTAWSGMDANVTASVGLYAGKFAELFMYCAAAMLLIAILYIFAIPFLKKAHQACADE